MRKNKNGIAVFDNNADLYEEFLGKAPPVEKGEGCFRGDGKSGCRRDSSAAKGLSLEMTVGNGEGKTDPGRRDSQKSAASGESDDSVKSLKKLRKDKHGLPFLDGAGTLSRFFKDMPAESEEEQFPALLDASLKGRNKAAMMREKKDKILPAPVPLKKRLKRYPPPQKELDLHGYTAREGQSRAESWLRRLWRNGFFTVRIIVGRGIHSEFGAVLPDVVEDLLITLKRDGVVLWFEWDRKNKSQSGAVIAYLKQFD